MRRIPRARPTCGLMTVFWVTSITSHTRRVPSSEQVSAVVRSVGCQQPPVQLVTWPAGVMGVAIREGRIRGGSGKQRHENHRDAGRQLLRHSARLPQAYKNHAVICAAGERQGACLLVLSTSVWTVSCALRPTRCVF